MANNWRGCKNIKMIWHGEWSDPELVTEYDDTEYRFNYHDIEDALWYDFLESNDITEKDTYDENGNISDEYENMFSKYCQDNAYTYLIWDVIPELPEENFTVDNKFYFWDKNDTDAYNSYFEDGEDDEEYDVDESCSGKKKKKKLKEDVEDNVYYVTFFSETDVPIKASSVNEAHKIAMEMTDADYSSIDYSNVYLSGVRDIYNNGRIVRDCQKDDYYDEIEHDDVDESYHYFTDYGMQCIKDAKKLGLIDLYEPTSGAFEFTIEDLKKHKDNIKKWLEIHPEDVLNREEASVYDTETPDGYLYFIANPEDFDIPEDKIIDIDSI